MPYAIVQHSGVTTGHAEFEQAVEMRQVDARQARKVRSIGGLVVDDWAVADALTETINYPEGYEGMIPRAIGMFSEVTIDGLRVYLPVREVVG